MKYIKFYENFSSDHLAITGLQFFIETNKSYLRYYNNVFDAKYTEDDFDKIINILENECGEFLNELKNKKQYPIFRGAKRVEDSNNKGIYYKQSYSNRTPVDSDRLVTKFFDDLFYDKFGLRIRSNGGIFTTKSLSTSKSYGESYIFFPLDGYKYFWNKEINDLFTFVEYQDWYGKVTMMYDMYQEEYGAPYKNQKGDGKWVCSNSGEYDTVEEAKTKLSDVYNPDNEDHYIYDFIEWVPSITYGEYERIVIEDTKDEIFNIVDNYEEGNIENINMQEITFSTKNYCLIDNAFLSRLIKYLGLEIE